MAMPEFTPEERYLIAHVKSREATRMNVFMLVYLLTGLAWFAFGVHHDSYPMMFAGFGTFVVGRLYEENYWWKFLPAWKSLIEKFEAACTWEPAQHSQSQAN